MKTIYKFLGMSFILLIMCCNSGCDFVEIDSPVDKIITTTLFQNEGTATSAVLGLYSELVSPGNMFSHAGTTIYTGLAADELYVTSATALEDIQFQDNQIAVDNRFIYNNFWRKAYEIIYHANLCIEGIEASTSISEASKKQLLGECYFIRAFCYWYLVNLFGDVPLSLSSDYEINRQLSKTDKTLIKLQIEEDLLEARNRLSAEYPSSGVLRVNYYTALALLSRYYLYEENWTEVEKLTTEIINSPLYNYETDINTIFLIGSSEAIWQIGVDSSIGSLNTAEGAAFIPLPLPFMSPAFGLTEQLLSDFEDNDLRRTAWTASKIVSGTTYTYPHKYKIRLSTTRTENYVMFRLGEIYLSRAEAYAHLNRHQDALDDLNIIRQRANLPEKTIADTPDVVGAILKERRIELFAEWGHRWFDLKRTGKIDQVLGTVKPNWQTTAAWFPIPQTEILVNPNLTQNQGYNN